MNGTRGNPSRQPRARIKAALYVQVVLSGFFILVGMAFPVYIAIEYGISNYPLHDRYGSVIGSVSYILLGVVLGLVSIAIGTTGIVMAKRSLADPKLK